MQEVMEDGSEGKTFVENTIEELLPHIKKSLSDPNVKFVKVFRGKTLVAKVATTKIEKEVRFIAEEEKKNIMDKIAEQKKKNILAPTKELFDELRRRIEKGCLGIPCKTKLTAGKLEWEPNEEF